MEKPIISKHVFKVTDKQSITPTLYSRGPEIR